MRKPFTRLVLLFIILFSQYVNAQPICGFDGVHGKSLKNDSSYRRISQLNDQQLQTIIQEQAARRAQAPNARVYNTQAALYVIPVVVHVVHTGGAVGSIYNPADAKITAAINYLNQIYAGTYPGTEGVGDIQVQFALAQRDPNCNATNGIDRVNGSSITNYTTNGLNAVNTNGVQEGTLKNFVRWDPYSYYNIWVVNRIDGADGTSGQFIAGYARFPGGDPNMDGTIMLATQMDAGFKTLPHEIGHALALYHPFQGSTDATNCPSSTNCSGTGDFICDTDPISYNQTGGVVDFTCRTGANACAGGAPYSINTEHNIMNYTNCFTLFTAGQKSRMLAAMSLRGRREYAGGWALSAVYPVSYAAPSGPGCTPVTQINPSGNVAGIMDVRLNNRIFSSSTADGDLGYLTRTGSCLNLINLVANGTYTLGSTLEGVNVEQVKAWIDYNNNGVFETGEMIQSVEDVPNPGNSVTVNTSFTIPASATLGAVLRMRVIDEVSDNVYGPGYAITGPCYNPQYGQAEDYAILISPAALPLTMDYFKGTKSGNSNHLIWKTISEVNTDSFVVERSYTGSDYTRIGALEATGITTGSLYAYDDNSYTGPIAYYRLKQIDLNGSYTYSNIVTLKAAAISETEITVLNNPFKSKFDISLNTPISSKAVIRLLDVTGKQVHAQSAAITGNTVLTITPPASHLAPGVYIVQIQMDGKTISRKVIKE